MAEKQNKPIRIKLDKGTVYQKEVGGTYYFRYQVKKERKCVSLKTQNQEDALKEAKKLLPIINETNAEVIAAHVNIARHLATKKQGLSLVRIWEIYSKHSSRALPDTVREQLSYHATLDELIRFLGDKVEEFCDITSQMATDFAEHLKTTGISVNTHNRKIIRLRKIFSTLQEYRDGENPFASFALRRKEREEQGNVVRRVAFSREQEDAILKELNNPKRKLMNKAEIRVIYYLGMFTGQRLKDCVLLQRDKVDLKKCRIWVKQFKTGKEVSIPIAEPLLAVLKEAMEWKENNFVCPKVARRYMIVDSRGKGVGDGLVNIDVLRVIKWIGLETSVEVPGRKRKMTVYGFHSLRHSFASFCAEAGVPKAVVVSILGANSEIIDQFYTHVGEEAQEKAIAAIAGKASSTNESSRIERALERLKKEKRETRLIADLKEILQG